jgi:glycosyltransferase involved in cell wall biosynthesis
MGMATKAKLERWRRRVCRLVDEEVPVTQTWNGRVGFIVPAGLWMGGQNYLRNLFAAIRSLPGRPLTPVVFTGSRGVDGADFSDAEIISTSLLDQKSVAWFLRKVIDKTIAQDVLMRKLLQQHDISVLSHSFHLGHQTAIKTIGWIPDFQQVALPQFFTTEEITKLDRRFASTCAYCDKVVVSSECARADLKLFSPAQAHKAELLRFVASPVPLDNAATLPELQRLYNFSGSFFLLPNQFWAHKNHRVVLGALREMKRQRLRPLVLATGSTRDHRDPAYFPSFMQYAAECDVLDCFRVLGQIPFEHLAGLMRDAVALINPSKFEGWSTSVEEAKSMGKQIVLSDILVHREQAPERDFFFPAEDPEALAEAMIAAYNGFDVNHDIAMRDAALMRFPERLRGFGEAYLAIVTKAIES